MDYFSKSKVETNYSSLDDLYRCDLAWTCHLSTLEIMIIKSRGGYNYIRQWCEENYEKDTWSIIYDRERNFTTVKLTDKDQYFYWKLAWL